MTVALETEIVGSRYDPKKRACFYTIERNGRRWTVEVAQADLDKHRGKRLRRQLVGKRLQDAMNGPHDKP